MSYQQHNSLQNAQKIFIAYHHLCIINQNHCSERKHFSSFDWKLLIEFHFPWATGACERLKCLMVFREIFGEVRAWNWFENVFAIGVTSTKVQDLPSNTYVYHLGLATTEIAYLGDLSAVTVSVTSKLLLVALKF